MRRRSITSGLVLLAYALALVQRPGEVVADTKVDLYVAPARFLSNVLSVWSPTTDLGHVFGAPVQRLRVADGAVVRARRRARRADLDRAPAVARDAPGAGGGRHRAAAGRAGDPTRGVLHVAAGVLFIVNPYITVYANRTSISLLSYAALPWLLLARPPRAARAARMALAGAVRARAGVDRRRGERRA